MCFYVCKCVWSTVSFKRQHLLSWALRELKVKQFHINILLYKGGNKDSSQRGRQTIHGGVMVLGKGREGDGMQYLGGQINGSL